MFCYCFKFFAEVALFITIRTFPFKPKSFRNGVRKAALKGVKLKE